MRHQPAELEVRQALDQPRQRRCVLRTLHAGAPEARVAVDEERRRRAAGPERSGDRARRDVGIRADGDPRAPGEVGETLGLPDADERERDQDVVESVVGHQLRLAELLARDASRARSELEPREDRHLVRLHVRPERQPVLVAVALHARDVPVDRVEVDREERRRQIGDRHHGSRSSASAVGPPGSNSSPTGPR